MYLFVAFYIDKEFSNYCYASFTDTMKKKKILFGVSGVVLYLIYGKYYSVL